MTKNHAEYVLVRSAQWSIVIRRSMDLNECSHWRQSRSPIIRTWRSSLGDVVGQLFANQTAKEAFERRAGEHCELFGTEFGDDPGAAGLGSSEKRFFGDGPADVDLRRIGTSRRN